MKYAFEPLVGFRSRKAAQVAGLFLKLSTGKMDKLKLIKLIYLMERESIRERGRPMLYDEYYSLPHGPICSSSLNGMNGELDQQTWSCYVQKDGKKDIFAVKDLDDKALDELSESDRKIISHVWTTFGWMSASQLRNWTHRNCSEYAEVEEGRLPISPREIAAAVNHPDPDELENSVVDYRSAEMIIGR